MNTEFFNACAHGDTARVRATLADNPELARAVAAGGPHQGWTALHEAARHGRGDIVSLLLEYGADPNAREAGDVHGFGADHAIC
jgi:hypothetical protein